MDMVRVGEICGTYGYRGEVKVVPMTDFPERFQGLSKIGVMNQSGVRWMEIESLRNHNQFIVMKLKGIDAKEEAALLTRSFLVVDESEVYPLPEGTYYIFQLIGLEVWDQEKGSLGRLTEVLETGANDVYVVRGEKYGEVLIPAIQDVVLSVNLETNKMEVRLLPGLVVD
jgi:16S rRNA processing protein RimM